MCAGTGQGRKFSLHAFTALMKWLDDAIRDSTAGIRAWLPPFARQALDEASRRCVPHPAALATLPVDVRSRIVAELARTVSHDCPPWGASIELAADRLSALSNLADRINVLEEVGALPIGPLLYVDDVTTLCASIGGVAAAIKVGCSSFASRTRSYFNHGPSKTAVLPFLGAAEPTEEEVGCAVVHMYNLLGVLFDSAFSFEPQLNRVPALGRNAFYELFHISETAGFSVPVEAHQVTVRVEPIVMYGAELLILVPHAEKALNDLQFEWATAFLKAKSWDGRLRMPLAINQCGWCQRLGTKMVEAAVIARARLFLLPSHHPAAALQRLADATQVCTWSRAVRQCMSKHSIPDLWATDFGSSECIAAAIGNSDSCKSIIRRYKHEFVRPALREYDQLVFDAAATKILDGLGVTYKELQPGIETLPTSLTMAFSHASSWSWFRIWAGIRLTGRWPAYLYEQRTCPCELLACPLCARPNVTVAHALCECPATRVNLQTLQVHAPCTHDSMEFLVALFDNRCFGDQRIAQIEYVGRCVEPVLEALFRMPVDDFNEQIVRIDADIVDLLSQCENYSSHARMTVCLPVWSFSVFLFDLVELHNIT